MSLLTNLLSSIDPTAAPKATPESRQAQASGGVSKEAARPAGATNGSSHVQAVKRKADAPPDGSQPKIQRKDGVQPVRPNGSATARPAPGADVAKSRSTTPSTSIPYRGTAGTGGSGTVKSSSTVVKKTAVTMNTPTTASKPAAAAPSPAPSAASVKKGSYAAMLQRAKEAQQAKAPTPVIKHEPTKILTKAERLALRAEAKGKKTGLTAPAGPARAGDAKGDAKDKRKPAEVGYQGTARPVKKPVEIAYKGTARPTTPGSSTGKPAAASKTKSKQPQGRYGGYASWSDEEEEMVDDEEEDYESDDMEGGIWDVEEEEQLALKAAKKEDAEALREEMELKRQKEERKRKLLQMSKAAAAKKKY